MSNMWHKYNSDNGNFPEKFPYKEAATVRKT
jgi:hypothetical protein